MKRLLKREFIFIDRAEFYVGESGPKLDKKLILTISAKGAFAPRGGEGLTKCDAL